MGRPPSGYSRSKRLIGKVAVVINAMSGVGLAACDQLASEGAKLVIVDPDGVSARLTAEEVNILVGGLDPNYWDIGEDPWGAKQTAVPLQMQVNNARDLLAVMGTAARIFNAPVDLVFDSLGSIDPKAVREVARHVNNSGLSHEPTTIVTITTIGCPGVYLPGMPCGSVGSEVSADFGAMRWPRAHVIGGSQVWQRLKQLSQPLLDINGVSSISQKGCLKMHCDDGFGIVAHLMSGSDGLTWR